MAKEKPSRSQTKLTQHRRTKKKLTPPLAEIPNLQSSSWLDDRMPEMLWASLIVTAFPRDEALRRIMAVVKASKYIADELEPPSDHKDEPMMVMMSGIAALGTEHRERLISAMAPDDVSKSALRPLLLLESLPAKESWRALLGSEPNLTDWAKLADAVHTTFLHQSQEATDCRWASVACGIVTGRIKFVGAAMESAELVQLYATFGEEDLRKARPTVRSMEIAFALKVRSKWSTDFWEECRTQTRCIVREFDQAQFEAAVPSQEVLKKQRKRAYEINQSLTDHFWATLKTTSLDSKHQAAFGIALYASDIVTSAVALGMGRTAQGRMTLRTLVECLISLAYLALKDDPDLWLAYRKHGQGQAKLVCQRAEEDGRQPKYMDLEALGFAANEDVWVEFLPIEIGHWDGSNLRAMAESVGLKSVYDDYYTWPSSYVHGQWGAIREYVFDFCRNPLHRVHKVPLLVTLTLPDCYEDFYVLLNQILDVLYSLYPRPKRSKTSADSKKKPDKKGPD